MHCKVGTDGEAFHPNLDPQPFDAIFLKGEHEAAYSGFEGRTTRGAGLADWLREHEVIDEVDVCGIATDHCVRRHRARRGRERLHDEGAHRPQCAGIAPATTKAAIEAMRDAGRHHWLTSMSAPTTARSG